MCWDRLPLAAHVKASRHERMWVGMEGAALLPGQ